MRKLLSVLAFLLLHGLYTHLQAQSLTHYYQHWYTYFGTAGINERWSVPFDVQVRLRDGISTKGQIMLRGGLQYMPNKRTGYLLGYANIPTYSPALDAYQPEHRIYEQFIYKMQQPAFTMTHRVRLEQRWAGQKTHAGNNGGLKVSHWKYGNRFRYFNRTQFPLKKEKQPTGFYLALQNELFMNLWGNEINDKFIDQNRFLITPGYTVKPNLKVELGYMNHYQQFASGDEAMNHVVHFSVIHEFML
ncbi:MAG TPA: DUF2490 domain-containing protein [Chitinophaga sp.]|uniref:DUF2490 domain-containing protein n=1 Tax=Chitinophaga sp. TaxID=1869181 RepID=UPI002DBA4F58|nr:DUF2490 domain-containing protein [Chitinophaga sp.]HEU4553343.1 DUF2490 domain-containing protein [Chitinophaga sp.]